MGYLFSAYLNISILVSALLIVPHVVIGADFYSLELSPSDVSLEDLISKWWNWWHTIPSDVALIWPSCLIGDGGSIGNNESVVFLANPSFANDANINRTNQNCQITSDQAIFFPLYNSVCDTSMPEFEVVDYAMMLQCAKDSNTEPNAKVFLNGTDVSANSFELYTSEPFNLVYADENPYEDVPGDYTGVGGGYYVFLKPLPEGDYELHYTYDRQIASERGDAKYRISVVNTTVTN